MISAIVDSSDTIPVPPFLLLVLHPESIDEVRLSICIEPIPLRRWQVHHAGIGGSGERHAGEMLRMSREVGEVGRMMH